jgi:AAA+ ATPase superfamily predicted ATPase
MRYKIIKPNAAFIGRHYEIERLQTLAQQDKASIVVVHGRRRAGKTELIEQCFRQRRVLKFEGIEGHNEAWQRQQVMRQLAEYTGEVSLASLKYSSWLEVFEQIARYVATGVCTLFFEELQWLADYGERFVAELKHVWDNKFRHNDKLLIVLCGSSPSFMIGKVLHSNALYNRSMHELPLLPFSLAETRQFLGSRYGEQEVMDAYLTVGGIPEYLRYIRQDSSVFLSLCKHAFIRGGFFSTERDRVFVSSLARNAHYGKIVDFLSRRKFASRTQIAAHLKADSGGSLSDLLTDLTLCGFIERLNPFNLAQASKLARFAVRDPYLQFYYKFIGPKRSSIERGAFDRAPASALASNTYYTWLGYAFERYCRSQQQALAAVLGFGAVNFSAGPFYNRATDLQAPGYQIDLVFDRSDRVFTLCEIKYLRVPATVKVADEFEKKLALFPNVRNKSIHKVLISANGADKSLAASGYFDRIVTLEDIFSMA